MKEVARTLDLSLATVKARLHRARKQLTCSAAFKERVPNAGSISGSKRQYVIPDSRIEKCHVRVATDPESQIDREGAGKRPRTVSPSRSAS